ERLDPLLEYAVTLDGHERACAGVGVLDEVTRRVADLVFGGFRHDLERVVVAAVPHELTGPGDPGVQGGSVPASARIGDRRGQPIAAGCFRHEAADAGFAGGAAIAGPR